MLKWMIEGMIRPCRIFMICPILMAIMGMRMEIRAMIISMVRMRGIMMRSIMIMRMGGGRGCGLGRRIKCIKDLLSRLGMILRCIGE